MVEINTAISFVLAFSIAVLLLILLYFLSREVLDVLLSGSLRKRDGSLKGLIIGLDQATHEEDRKRLQSLIEKRGFGLGPTILEMLPIVSRETRVFLTTVLGERGFIRRYMKELDKKKPARRLKALRTFGVLQSDQAVAAVTGLLRDPDRAVRQEATKTLASIGDNTAVPPLVELLEEPGWGDLSFVSSAVASFGPCAEELVRPLLRMESPTPRYWAAEILGELKSRRSVGDLIALLKDEKANVRGNAARALGLIGSIEAVDPLAKACSDRSWFVRSRSVEALGAFLKKPLAVSHVSFILSVLIFLLGDREWSVREKAVLALSKLDNHMVTSYLIKAVSQEDRQIACECAKMLGGLKTRAAFGALIHALKSDRPELRGSSAEALGRVGDEQALPHLIDLLRDKEWYVQERAAKALGDIGDRRALDALYLVSMSGNWWVRFRAREAVKSILERAPMNEAEAG